MSLSLQDDDLQVVILNGDHDLNHFRCKNQELEDFLKQDASTHGIELSESNPLDRRDIVRGLLVEKSK